ncbi:MAG: carboxylesterase family protein [Bacteroidales bacterium]|nr:carboxylesterase family protein [Bacteroidales bacterium]
MIFNKKYSIILCIILFCRLSSYSQEIKTYAYAQRDTCTLFMDVYHPVQQREDKTAIVFVFGGGFRMGERSAPYNLDFFKQLNEKGFVVITIDYRLALKDANRVDALHNNPLAQAIDIAVEDLFSAVSYIISHAEELNVNSSNLVLCGSSAGAITVLQADYELANRRKSYVSVPEGFRFGGVISFAGAIFSHHGKLKYTLQTPAPTFLLHGKDDFIVTYKKIVFFNLGFYGTDAMVKRFEKLNYPYFAIRYRNLGHEVAGVMKYNVDEITWFVDTYVIAKKQLKIDQYYLNPEMKRNPNYPLRPRDLYRKGRAMQKEARKNN